MDSRATAAPAVECPASRSGALQAAASLSRDPGSAGSGRPLVQGDVSGSGRADWHRHVEVVARPRPVPAGRPACPRTGCALAAGGPGSDRPRPRRGVSPLAASLVDGVGDGGYSPLRARTNSVSSASFRSDTAQNDMPSRIQWNVEPSQGSDLNGGERGTALPGDEHVDRVPTPQIHECRDRTTLEIVEAATGDGKPQPGEINDGRREVELAEEPGLDGVAAAIASARSAAVPRCSARW